MVTAPSLAGSLCALASVARFHAERIPLRRAHAQRMEAPDFPTGLGPGVGPGAFALVPFDFMSDTLRGMRGVFLDMHRRPEKSLAAEEKARRICTDATIQACRATGSRFAFIPLQRGWDGLMSLGQSEAFYWSQLKRLVMDLVDAGIMPGLFYEGT